VFAVIARGMAVVDRIGRLPLVDLRSSMGDAFFSTPVLRNDGTGIDLDDFVVIRSVRLTDTVEEQPIDDNSEFEEQQRLFQCVADWIQEVQPREVCMESNVGGFCMDLMPEVASKTVANFLHYVVDGDYNNTFIHRMVPGFVVQGGGFRTSPPFSRVPVDPTIDNEYSTPNTRGTVALAKQPNLPNSGSSEWFVNVADNSEGLNANNNGGFTVFGRVREADMGVFDNIANLPRRDLYQFVAGGSPGRTSFAEVPLRRSELEGGMTLDDLVVIKRAFLPGHETNPCYPVKPQTVTEYKRRAFTAPVRMDDGKIYEFQFARTGIEDTFIFQPALWNIREVADIGQPVATYSAATQLMHIPTVLTPDNSVLYNVRLRMSNLATFQFTLESFDLQPPAP
jgi:peptidyl-prolyl cis-trans isomerase A (cyclophilin A)